MTVMPTRTGRSRSRTAVLLFAGLCVALAIAGFAVTAYSSVADEQREGQRVLRSVDSGDRRCDDLSNADFERVGEYVMGRMAGSTKAHEQMNQLMSNMMGARGEEQMHEFMGRRFAGCAHGKLPGGLGAMMGSMGMIGGAMMGGGSGTRPRGHGSMMGGTSSDDDEGDWGSAAIVMIVLMAALLAAVAGLLLRGSWRRGAARSPLDILDDRFARGEVDSDDYKQRRQALGGDG